MIGVCVVGVGGIIAESIADNNAVALTFGLVTAAAVACLMVATAVSSPSVASESTGFDEEQAARVEDLVGRLVADGASEHAVRHLVGEAVRLGRSSAQIQEIPHIAAPDADD